MKFLEQLDDFVVGKISFPFVSYLLNRRHILSNYRKLMESEWYPEDVLKDLQLEKLIGILGYASKWSPYYASKFKAIGLEPGDIKTLEDVRRIPTLSRQEVIDHHREMVDIRYQSSILTAEQSKRGPGVPAPLARFRRHRLVMNTSTGSTGAPTTFYDDGSTMALIWAHELRWKEWYGLRPGVREARLARVATEYLPNSRMLWLRKCLWHNLILPGMNLSDADYAMCLRKIKEFQPKILLGITSALTGLAGFIRHHGEDMSPYQPSLVITWAAPLYEHEKSLLEEVFGAPVTNIYGSREVGHIAALCPHGSLHINQENYIVEIENDAKDDSTASPGEILVTTLFESPMPFIRYRIGDLGELARGNCPCGRTLQVMKNLLGRSGEVFITKDGRMIAPNFWCRLFMVGGQSQSVERFQVIIRKNNRICLRIVRKDNYSAETEADLRRSLEKNFHENTQFEFEYVTEIERHPSGKYQLVINEDTYSESSVS